MSNSVFINLPNGFVGKGASEYGDYHYAYLPKGTKIGDMDLSDGVIHTNEKFVSPNSKNEKLTTIRFDEDFEVVVKFKGKDNVKVKAKDLAEAVEQANKDYLQENSEVVYINVHKSYCSTKPSKKDETKNFNVMHLPNGTKIGDMDLSGAVINPFVMFENKKNPNLYTAVYNVSLLENKCVQVGFPVFDKDGKIEKYDYKPVDVYELKEAVDKANKDYLASKKAEKETSGKDEDVELDV